MFGKNKPLGIVLAGLQEHINIPHGLYIVFRPIDFKNGF